MKILKILLFVLMWLPLWAQYAQVGTDSTVDILTWNIEWFPKNGQTTIDETAQIISNLDGDVYAVEEISDSAAFLQLLSELPGWDGLLSPHRYSDGSYQKVGVIYNTQKAVINSWQLLFEGDTYAFPRPPLELNMTVSEGGHNFDFRLIIVHLKAYDDADSQQRRKAAIDSLKNYIDGQLALGGEQDFILLGDFNDLLEDPAQDNIFQPMLDDSATYTFLTEWLVGFQGSYIGYNEPDLIDHICITEDALSEYGDEGFTQVLYLDNENSNYENDVSDHRPVIAQFAFDNQPAYTPLAQIHQNFESYNQRMVKVKGVVTLGAGILSATYTSAYIQDGSEAGMDIYYADAVLSDFEQGADVRVRGQVIDYNGLHEVKYFRHQVLALNQPLPDPAIISTASINDVNADPGRWVTVEGTIESISGSGNISMMVNDGSGAGNIFFDADAGLDVSDFSVGDKIRVTGVKTVYNNEGEVEPGYQSDIEHGGTSLVEDDAPLPRSTVLFPSFPNPFNPQTTISYQLSAAGHVKMAVYNILGEEVRSLVNRNRAAGRYTVRFDGADLPSGIYFYRLTVRGRTVGTRRMVLLR